MDDNLKEVVSTLSNLTYEQVQGLKDLINQYEAQYRTFKLDKNTYVIEFIICLENFPMNFERKVGVDILLKFKNAPSILLKQQNKRITSQTSYYMKIENEGLTHSQKIQLSKNTVDADCFVFFDDIKVRQKSSLINKKTKTCLMTTTDGMMSYSLNLPTHDILRRFVMDVMSDDWEGFLTVAGNIYNMYKEEMQCLKQIKI